MGDGTRSTSALLPGNSGRFTINTDNGASGYEVKIEWHELDE